MSYQAPFVDIWSTGIILYAMLCGYLSFEGENNEKLYENIMKGEFEIINYLSDKTKDLIKKILLKIIKNEPILIYNLYYIHNNH